MLHNSQDSSLSFVLGIIKQMISKFSVFIYLLFTLLFTVFINSNNEVAVVIRDQGFNFFNTIILEAKESIAQIVPTKKFIDDTKNIMLGSEELQTENYKLKQDILKIEAQSQLNKEALNSINIIYPPAQNFISAKVVSFSANGDNNFFKIAAGKNQSVQIGNPVVNKEGLIGKIVKVHDNFSTAQSVKSYNFKISGTSTLSGTKCLIKGDGKESYLKASCLEINNFDTNGIENIVTAGNDGVFPYGIYLGKLKRLSEKEFIVEEPAMNRYDFIQIVMENLSDDLKE